jgi:signal transduction histidine kinase
MGLQAALEDLSERDADRLRTLLVAARDLRLPLDSICGSAALLLDGALPEDRRRLLAQDILNRAGQVLDVLDKLEDIARIDARSVALDIRPVDVSALVTERIDLMRRRAERKNIMIVSQFESMPAVPCDRDRMAQVMDHLLDNAVKFSPADTRVWIDVYRLGVAAVVSITDQGQGIPEHELTRLFGTFSRTSAQSPEGEQGSGLGLSIVRRIVEEHDGVVGVESRVGRGSSFRIVLPFTSAAGPA